MYVNVSLKVGKIRHFAHLSKFRVVILSPNFVWGSSRGQSTGLNFGRSIKAFRFCSQPRFVLPTDLRCRRQQHNSAPRRIKIGVSLVSSINALSGRKRPVVAHQCRQPALHRTSRPTSLTLTASRYLPPSLPPSLPHRERACVIRPRPQPWTDRCPAAAAAAECRVRGMMN